MMPKIGLKNVVSSLTANAANKLDNYWLKCSDCRDVEREAKRAVNSVEIEDYDGAIYDDGTDKYFFDVEEFLDHLACTKDDVEEFPEYVYACNESGFGSLDAGRVIESRLCEMFEDAEDHVIDLEGLQKSLDEWTAKQTMKCYEVDFARRINTKKLWDKYRT